MTDAGVLELDKVKLLNAPLGNTFNINWDD